MTFSSGISSNVPATIKELVPRDNTKEKIIQTGSFNFDHFRCSDLEVLSLLDNVRFLKRKKNTRLITHCQKNIFLDVEKIYVTRPSNTDKNYCYYCRLQRA
jgi:hypothetical protein